MIRLEKRKYKRREMESDLFRSSESKSKREKEIEGRESMSTLRGEDPVFIGNFEGKVAGQAVLGSRRGILPAKRPKKNIWWNYWNGHWWRWYLLSLPLICWMMTVPMELSRVPGWRDWVAFITNRTAYGWRVMKSKFWRGYGPDPDLVMQNVNQRWSFISKTLTLLRIVLF